MLVPSQGQSPGGEAGYHKQCSLSRPTLRLLVPQRQSQFEQICNPHFILNTLGHACPAKLGLPFCRAFEQHNTCSSFQDCKRTLDFASPIQRKGPCRTATSTIWNKPDQLEHGTPRTAAISVHVRTCQLAFLWPVLNFVVHP